MKWLVCFLAGVTILSSASSLYFAFSVALPSVDELGLSAEDAPNMQAISIYMIAKELLAIVTAIAAVYYALISTRTREV